ncbi:MAG: hypothetical protein A3F73_12265 [Gallionellales bacterium RIFCSPLOWO2_12_FULL_59_22]|nr:MAG: hypothetical protein A3H99_01565 [Gallionellales bacterium RIFCSPLOWO2_02_FULL_59_110]OGT02119.1 MAG: hypothetical protein A2Z65_10120 [Gallionellales bacterium RIFCSPLOWO2_02_58_13]OGT12237.1 MAG: hypothetical protein A3F73_12265 [Gallionellales bacterium RIFCSPLOWO2_12_FULL_59_22]
MPVPDFTDAEQKLVSGLLLKRYAKLVPLQLADSELQLKVPAKKLTLCPTLYWSERGAQFVVCKVADGRYRSQFFYSDAEQFGTGREEYDDLEDCVVTLLQVQSDHERQLANISANATRADTGDDYHGPVVV